MKLSLDNIKDFAVPLDLSIIGQFFTDEDNLIPTDEHKDQIFLFKKDASRFLWDFEHKVLGIEANPEFYKTVSTYDSNNKERAEIKKYLYNLEIPFKNWVFIAEQPYLGFLLTWKMVVKYSSGIFNEDQTVWDKTLNWKLEYHHDGIFTFGKDLIYSATSEGDKISTYLAEMKNRQY